MNDGTAFAVTEINDLLSSIFGEEKSAGIKTEEINKEIENSISGILEKSEAINKPIDKAIETIKKIYVNCCYFEALFKKYGVSYNNETYEYNSEGKDNKDELFALGANIIYQTRMFFLQEDFELRCILTKQENGKDVYSEMKIFNYSDLFNKGNIFKVSGQKLKIDYDKIKSTQSLKEILENGDTATDYEKIWGELVILSGTDKDKKDFLNNPNEKISNKMKNWIKSKANENKKILFLHKIRKEYIGMFFTSDNQTDIYSFKFPLSQRASMKKYNIGIVSGTETKKLDKGFLFEWYDHYVNELINRKKNKQKSSKLGEESSLEPEEGSSLESGEESYLKGKSAGYIADLLLPPDKNKYSRDTIEGYKMGDFLSYKKKWVQNKYGQGTKFINLRTIETVILNENDGILKMTRDFLTNYKNGNKEEIIQEFIEQFLKIYSLSNKDSKHYKDLSKSEKEHHKNYKNILKQNFSEQNFSEDVVLTVEQKQN